MTPPKYLLVVMQTFPNPKRISPQIQAGMNVNHVIFDFIIDAERETLRQHPMKSKVDWMNAGKSTSESRSERIESRK